MKTTFFSTRLGNQFFFISTLTNWHFSCRNGFIREWRQQTGPLSVLEKQALVDMTTILKKYRFGNPKKRWKYLGEYYMALPEDRAWPAIRKQVTKAEYAKLQKIFSTFEPHFAAIWKREEKRLNTAAKTLQEAVKSKKFLPLIHDLQILFRKNLLEKKLTVILCMRPSRLPWYMGGGSAIYGRNRFSLEAGDVNPKRKLRIKKMLLIFFHEATHAALAHPDFERRIGLFLKKTKKRPLLQNPLARHGHSPFNIINEAIVSSLLPEGYFEEKYFKGNLEKRYRRYFQHGITRQRQEDFHAWRIYAAFHLRPALLEYLKTKRPLDQEYIKATFRIFLAFLRKEP